MGLREEIEGIIMYPEIDHDHECNICKKHAKEKTRTILCLPLSGWITEEKCQRCQGTGGQYVTPHGYVEGFEVCDTCQGTGIITRPALLSDLERDDVRLRRKNK